MGQINMVPSLLLPTQKPLTVQPKKESAQQHKQEQHEQEPEERQDPQNSKSGTASAHLDIKA